MKLKNKNRTKKNQQEKYMKCREKPFPFPLWCELYKVIKATEPTTKTTTIIKKEKKRKSLKNTKLFKSLKKKFLSARIKRRRNTWSYPEKKTIKSTFYNIAKRCFLFMNQTRIQQESSQKEKGKKVFLLFSFPQYKKSVSNFEKCFFPGAKPKKKWGFYRGSLEKKFKTNTITKVKAGKKGRRKNDNLMEIKKFVVFIVKIL